MKRKTSRIVVTCKGKKVIVDERALRGNAQIERAKRKADRMTRKHGLQAVFQK